MKIYSTEFFYKNILSNKNKSDVAKALSKKNYKEYTIPKKGGSRVITYLEKDNVLYQMQNSITSKLLNDEPLPICVKGFVKGESYRSFLEPHIGRNFFLRVDIQDFFGSIDSDKIKNMLDTIVLVSDKDEKLELVSVIVDILSYNEHLPQGACSSPTVSNLCFRNIDQRITKYCQKLQITYTRYADDLLFSSENFDFQTKKWFLRKIRTILRADKYKLNYSKIKYGKAKLSINGFVIDKECIRISRKRCQDIKRILYATKENCALFSENQNDFLNKINSIKLNYRGSFESISSLVQYINGYRSFLISWIDLWNSDNKNQKEIIRLIKKCETCVNILR